MHIAFSRPPLRFESLIRDMIESGEKLTIEMAHIKINLEENAQSNYFKSHYIIKMHNESKDIERSVLITVGTTEFQGLVEFTDSTQFIEMLKKSGISESKILYQIGLTGKYVPKHGKYLKISDEIHQIYKESQIIITHGGAGTLLTCLYDEDPNKKIISVANDTLAGNHQTEIITKLDSEGYILGFSSVASMKQNLSKVQEFINSKTAVRKYLREQNRILNDLIFN